MLWRHDRVCVLSLCVCPYNIQQQHYRLYAYQWRREELMSVLYPNKVERNTIENPLTQRGMIGRRTMAQLICARLEHVKSFVSVIKNRSNTQVFSSHSQAADLNIIWQSKTTSRSVHFCTYWTFWVLRTPLINSSSLSLSLEIRSSCKNNKRKGSFLLSSSTVCWSTPAEVLVEANYTGEGIFFFETKAISKRLLVDWERITV